jgi:hypothetical protein
VLGHFFVENPVKIGLLLVEILLTVAVLSS